MTEDAQRAEADDAVSRKRQDLLHIARRHFTSEGYASTRMEAVARDASVSTATLYAFFPSKADLFVHVIEDTAEEFARQIDRIRIEGDDARARLTAFATAYADFMSQPLVHAIFRLMMAERRRFRRTADAFLEKSRERIGRPLLALLQDETERGALRMDEPAWAAGQLLGMIEHVVFFIPLVTGEKMSAQRSVRGVAEEAVQTFLSRYGTDQG